MAHRAKRGEPRFPLGAFQGGSVAGLAGFDGFYLWYGIDVCLSPKVKADHSLPN
ncbi:MAG TPA: hypothetical protein VMV27_03020 [Candidatus Binataceae bacterium]|nr:hypothetical protein [Candidatus Binataceae bacterium]